MNDFQIGVIVIAIRNGNVTKTSQKKLKKFPETFRPKKRSPTVNTTINAIKVNRQYAFIPTTSIEYCPPVTANKTKIRVFVNKLDGSLKVVLTFRPLEVILIPQRKCCLWPNDWDINLIFSDTASLHCFENIIITVIL
jgi:hypothetical protein